MIFLTACKFEGSFTDLAPELPSLGNDFRNSYIEAPTNALADNASILEVVIYFINSDGSRVGGYTPQIGATMSGLASLGCSVTDIEGRSVCRFKSSQAGTFTVSVENIGFGLTKQAKFDPVVSQTQNFGIAAGGSQKMTGPGGWVVQATVGAPTSQTVLSNGDGWKVYVDVQGGLVSDHE